VRKKVKKDGMKLHETQITLQENTRKCWYGENLRCVFKSSYNDSF